MRVIIATARLSAFQGSEMTTLELARWFSGQGHEVDLLTGCQSEAFTPLVKSFSVHQALPRGGCWDLAWVHHKLGRLFPAGSCGAMISNHMSPFFEIEGWVENPLRQPDLVLCNSEETRTRIEAESQREDIGLFQNPAPACFHCASTPKRLDTFLFISNHPPDEVREAAQMLAQLGLQVNLIGMNFGSVRPVRPDDLFAASAVVTIGKSVQYALRAKRPVFVYDHFGGDGYLSAGNFRFSEKYNFSGRAFARRHSAEQLVRRLLNGDAWEKSLAFVADGDFSRFCLEARLPEVLGAAGVNSG